MKRKNNNETKVSSKRTRAFVPLFRWSDNIDEKERKLFSKFELIAFNANANRFQIEAIQSFDLNFPISENRLGKCVPTIEQQRRHFLSSSVIRFTFSLFVLKVAIDFILSLADKVTRKARSNFGMITTCQRNGKRHRNRWWNGNKSTIEISIYQRWIDNEFFR